MSKEMLVLLRMSAGNKTDDFLNYLSRKKYLKLDIFFSYSAMIKNAICNNNHKVIEALLEYYENNVILKSKDEDEKDKSYAKLGKVLDEIISEFVFNKGKLSDEMLAVLSPYISLEDIEKMEVIETERKMDESFSEHEAAETHDVGHLLGDTVE
jgi:hypothetical protein